MENAIVLIWACCVAYIVLLPHMPDNYRYWCEVASRDWDGIRHSDAWDRIYR